MINLTVLKLFVCSLLMSMQYLQLDNKQFQSKVHAYATD